MEKVYVGTNYHPHDHTEKRVAADIKRMQQAGLNVVRLGHLCWDSFEPSDGQFEFAWFDHVLDLFQQAHIDVILDIATRPAPLWLHRKFPSINICNADGVMMRPITRYMEDLGDPHFQAAAFKFAAALVQRYGHHPAVMAFGLCNEVGSGFLSYSPTAEARFRLWLEAKYHTVERLNQTWATQRWSRHVNNFDDVLFPINSVATGAPEAVLDMRRFFSDEAGQYLADLQALVHRLAPDKHTSSNHWAERGDVGFDYLKYQNAFVDVPGGGFYPGVNPLDINSLVGACAVFDHRIGESGKNIWGLEFQTGTFGGFSGPKNLLRMHSYLSLVYRNAMVCAWTWDSMVAGEEQYLFGLLNHDGQATDKLTQLTQFAQEMQLPAVQPLFPRQPKPRVAVAYSYESTIVTERAQDYYQDTTPAQFAQVYQDLFRLNVDVNTVDLRRFNTEAYDVLIIPGIALIDASMAANIRRFVEQGGHVVATAYSFKVNEHNSVYATPMPALVDDIFGVTVQGFSRAYTFAPSVNEGGVAKSNQRVQIQKAVTETEGGVLNAYVDYYEMLEPHGADNVIPLMVDNQTLIGCSRHAYGQGVAYYLAIPADGVTLTAVLKQLFDECGIHYEESDELVMRDLANGAKILINRTPHAVTRQFEQPMQNLLSGTTSTELELAAYDVAIVQEERK